MTNTPQPDFEAAITRALELRPEPVIPADFAARVMHSLPAQTPARTRSHIGRLRLGRTAGLIGGAILTTGLFALAPHTTASFSSLTFDLELLLLAELGALGYWLTVRREA
jgi:hypothetical protein